MTIGPEERQPSPTGESREATAVRSVRTKRFKDQFSKLPAPVQSSAIKRYLSYFVADPFHPLLERHVLYDVDDAHPNSFAVTIGHGYRAVGFQDGSTYIWYWCGPHGAYDTRFRKGK